MDSGSIKWINSLPAQWPARGSKEEIAKESSLRVKCREELVKEYGQEILEGQELREGVQ